jgi:hypothetical protein
VADVAFVGTGTPSVVVAGALDGTGSIGAADVTTAGGTDVFLSRFSGATGANTFARLWGGTGNDEPLAMTALTTTAEIYLTGWFSGPADFGGTPLMGTNDIFVAHYIGNANHVWSKSFAGTIETEKGTSISVTESGTVAVGASLSSPTTVGSTTLTPEGVDGAVILLRRTDGVVLGTYQVGGANSQVVQAVHASNDAIVVAGDFTSTVNGLGGSRNGNGMQDIFVGYQKTQ